MDKKVLNILQCYLSNALLDKVPEFACNEAVELAKAISEQMKS